MVDEGLNRQLRCRLGHLVRISLAGPQRVVGVVEEVHLHSLVLRDRLGRRRLFPTSEILTWKDGGPARPARGATHPA